MIEAPGMTPEQASILALLDRVRALEDRLAAMERAAAGPVKLRVIDGKKGAS